MCDTEVTLEGADGLSIKLATGLFINNEFVASRTGSTLETTNPATGQPLATVSAAAKEDVDLAVSAAGNAFVGHWSKTQANERQALLLKLADLMERDIDEFASLEALDAGVIFGSCKSFNIPLAVEVLRYYAGWASKINGKVLKTPQGMSYTIPEPLGVCGAIVPWNAPTIITCWKLGPCIATGNTLVIKTAELSPLYGLKLGALIKEAGFPPGVINIATGLGNIAGQALAEHMDVRKIAFTGSGTVGRKLLIASAKSNLKRVTLELGGKGATIIFDDADLENAVMWATLGINSHNGQICAAGSRIYVQSGIYDRFIAAFRESSSKAVAGDPLLSSTTKGPIISANQHSKILSYIQNGQKEGAKLLYGGEEAPRTEGNYVANTAFTDVGEDMSIMKEEIFGPVASIAKFSTESEVLQKANATSYGLANAVFTSDVSRAQRVSGALESGMVTVNMWGGVHCSVPFGGVKQSGFGRDMGEDALESWINFKSVSYNILPEKTQAVNGK